MKDVLMGDEESIKTGRSGGGTVRWGRGVVGTLGGRGHVRPLRGKTWEVIIGYGRNRT